MRLLFNPPLNGRDRLLLECMEPCHSPAAKILGEGLGGEWFGSVEGGIEGGLADEVVLDCKAKGGYIASIHQTYHKHSHIRYHPKFKKRA